MVTGKEKTAPLFKALGDPIREAIVEVLADGPQPVHRLASRFSVSRPAVSRHLRLLKESGLVGERRRGRERTYYLRSEALVTIGAWVDAMASVGGAVAGDGIGRVAEPRAVAVAAQPRRRRSRAVKKEDVPLKARARGVGANDDQWKAW